MVEYLKGIPDEKSRHPIIYALGRITSAWAELEFQVFEIMVTLNACIHRSVGTKLGGQYDGSPIIPVDLDAVRAVYFSQDSSRGRRQMVLDLAKARREQKVIHPSVYEAINIALSKAQKVSAQRNLFAHTPLRFRDDGKAELIAPDTIGTNIKRCIPPTEINKATKEILDLNEHIADIKSHIFKTPKEPFPSALSSTSVVPAPVTQA